VNEVIVVEVLTGGIIVILVFIVINASKIAELELMRMLDRGEGVLQVGGPEQYARKHIKQYERASKLIVGTYSYRSYYLMANMQVLTSRMTRHGPTRFNSISS